VFENLQRLPVHYLGHALRNRSYAVVKIHLPRRDIDGFVFLVPEAPASRPDPYSANSQNQ
jgi:hypothetical protein